MTVFEAGNGKGLWHAAAKAAKENFSKFKDLSGPEKTMVTNAIKNRMAADQTRFVEKAQLIDRALEKRGPWLKLGAKVCISKSDVAEALGKLPAALQAKLAA